MITNNLDTLGLKEPVSITGLLSRLGFEPTKNFGNETFYHNVFDNANRRTKNLLRVNVELDAWFDKDLGTGGNIVDFGLAYWRSLDQLEVKEKIIGLFNMMVPKSNTTSPSGRKRHSVKIPHYHVQEIRPIGGNPRICSYLNSVGLLDIPNEMLKEVYYYVIDQKGTRKDFFSAGWQNENGGWEVRSWYYSGCIGRRGMTFVPGEENSVLVFEELSHYLSVKGKDKILGQNILILNSPEFFNAAVHRASKFDEVSTFLGTDQLNSDFKVRLANIGNKITHH